MNIDNVVLVRAMNTVPINGELIPTCEANRLVPDKQSDFYHIVRRCVRNSIEQELGRSLDLYPESPDEVIMNEAMKDYYIATGDYYTTTLSFALNGLVPDDMNNKFSDKKIAVLEPIRNQQDADFVTVETIDTTIKGRVTTSDEAMLVIDQNYFSQLSKEVQDNLLEYYQVKLFDGPLKEAIENTLLENGYPALDLVQNRELKNITDCPEKESMLAFEDTFSEYVGASRLRLQQLTFIYGGGSRVDEIAHEKLAEEHENTLIVEEYYKNQLNNFIINKAKANGIEISDEDMYYMYTNYDRGQEVLEDTTRKLISAYGGIEGFKQFIQEYNDYTVNNYLSNEQIVGSVKEQGIAK